MAAWRDGRRRSTRLFAQYVTQRAARSLQEAEEARELELLSRLAATSYPRRRNTNYA